MEEIIKQKDEEIKRLHEIYDIENVIKMFDTLNDENDRMYNALMMSNLKNKHIEKHYNYLANKYKEKCVRADAYAKIAKDALALNED
tara:strand:- start:955 stop:1215 length:261 start_codon:yes stop_codon:yes gene_type:complete